MDPKQTLIDADQAVSEENLDESAALLDAYGTWRARGGFEPIMDWTPETRGDKFAEETARRLDDALRQVGVW